jgi:hypothetical protein
MISKVLLTLFVRLFDLLLIADYLCTLAVAFKRMNEEGKRAKNEAGYLNSAYLDLAV